MGKLTAAEAETMAAGIREEWKVLVSLMTEAEETEAWIAAGYDRPGDWLGDLPPLPSIAGRYGVALSAGQATIRPAARAKAKVSRPGRAASTTTRRSAAVPPVAGRREVTPRFKEGGKK